jgi:hypothetical protein
MYKPEKPFGGISILLIGDFVQLPVSSGRDLWSVMYGNVTGNDATASNLFQLFRIHELTTYMRAADCITHTRHVAAFRKLPSHIHRDTNGVLKTIHIINLLPKTFLKEESHKNLHQKT